MEALSNSRENTGLNGSQVHRFWEKVSNWEAEYGIRQEPLL